MLWEKYFTSVRAIMRSTSISSSNKYNLRSLYRVVAVELEIQTEDLSTVDRVVVEDLNIHLPLCKVFRSDKGDPWMHVAI